MKTFEISGHVVDSKTHHGIKQLRVEAWDKNYIFGNTFLGQAITGDRGSFNIQFDESRFKRVFDQRPDLFVKVYRDDKLIKSTEDSVLWDVQQEDIQMEVEVEDSENSNGHSTTPEEPPRTSQSTTRSILQATYTPKKAEAGTQSTAGTRGLEKGAFIARLRPSHTELDQLTGQYQNEIHQRSEEESAAPKRALTAIQTMASALSETGEVRVLGNAKQFANLEVETLTRVAQDLMALRQKMVVPHQLAQLRDSIEQATRSLTVEPVGYLHLEKMSFTPVGIERGELVHSVPLSPGEEVNITHREWSRTSEEFEKIVTDYLEGFSEEGVAEKSELSEAVNSQSQHSSAFNISTTVDAHYSCGSGSVNVSASVGYNTADSASKSTQLSRNHSSEITRKASTRTKQEHKISFRVASAAETEDQRVQRIKNPFLDRATRVDYYQLIRKWRVDLYRYNVRLTWDIAIPEPGSGLLLKLAEIRQLEQELELDFAQLFTLKPEEIGLEGYTTGLKDFTEIASVYGVPITEKPLDPRMPRSLVLDRMFEAEGEQCGDVRPVLTFRSEAEVPEGYQVDPEGIVHASFIWRKCEQHSDWSWEATNVTGGIAKRILLHGPAGNDQGRDDVTFTDWQGITGKVAVWILVWRIKYFSMTIAFDCVPTVNTFRAWQQRIWQAIHDGYQAQYYEMRQQKRARLSRLQEELGSQDALSLRRKEREEIMKGVLRWLLPTEGDGFKFFPVHFPSDGEVDIEEEFYDPDTGLIRPEPKVDRNAVLEHGEVIKFLHHAIEWENMLLK